jgi:demethylmenaquinone methyltransferase/2-methoxy-6-polyprenyl-1,4-benzoquinol methylase
VSGSAPGRLPAVEVQAMFDRIAPRYDLLNRLLSAGTDVRWRRRAVDVLARPAGAHVLDVCTGTADLLLEHLRRDARNRGTGVDISLGMLGRGVAKVARAGVGARAGLAAGDAMRLPFRDGRFDGALVAFGIRNVDDPQAALGEMCRVLRPGGRAVVLEFSMPTGWLGRAYRLYFRRVLPVLGGWISGDRGAYAYLPASVERFRSPAELGRLMESAGFSGVRWEPLTGGVAHVYVGERKG